MPKVDDQFAGHMFPGDPRNNATGAFGCIWPTVPAYKYQIFGPEADGDWLGYRVTPPTVTLVTPVTEHDVPRWEMLESYGLFEFVRLDKLPIDTEVNGFEWVLTWKNVGADPVISNSFTLTSPRTCNTDVLLPNWNFPEIPGQLGPGAKLLQVLWNEFEPPA